jgi:phage baseplate assembly protein W
MGYQVIQPYINVSVPNALGIGINSITPIYLTTEQALENLKNLLLTRIGERYIMPEFGTNLLNIIFQPNVAELKQEITDILTPPINRWLPYINIISIDTKTNEDDPTLNYYISITIKFSVSTYNAQNITIAVTGTGLLEIN